ncbi:MAG: hydrolase 1, exosortase A system-associated [Rhodocyclaceae bacterium]|nr:hydrolase 1, exosortase A system-associated [Rhodocyclaceae bacterium]
MSFVERGVVFPCAGERLVGVVAVPERPFDVGVVIVVGGPQYRAGSHRQFVLLARHLADAGYPVLRFDYRGMGDSSGEACGFQDVAPDIAAAVSCLQQECPAVRRVVLWGLCDAASAIMIYCSSHREPALSGLILLNPWVRSEATYAKAQVKHYYVQRLFQMDFWKKVVYGKFQILESLKGVLGALRQARSVAGGTETAATFQARMAQGFAAYPGAILLILSGRDLTAREFVEYARTSGMWTQMNKRERLRQLGLPESDHTFSSAEWRDEVEDATLSFLGELEPQCAVS